MMANQYPTSSRTRDVVEFGPSEGILFLTRCWKIKPITKDEEALIPVAGCEVNGFVNMIWDVSCRQLERDRYQGPEYHRMNHRVIQGTWQTGPMSPYMTEDVKKTGTTGQLSRWFDPG